MFRSMITPAPLRPGMADLSVAAAMVLPGVEQYLLRKPAYGLVRSSKRISRH
ncbi:MAG: hypothetical protein VYE18_00275 [Pseudomonadota bacterium]|nr:hypothetical protein [Pseudomonadota bacterium]